MKINRVSVDYNAYQDIMARFMAFAAHLEGKEVNRKIPKLESITLTLHMILSGMKNSGFYTAESLADELDTIGATLRSVEGPKR
jgi:sulfate adenylyltransferase subunit 1 (EFTu-like GTPase family)